MRKLLLALSALLSATTLIAQTDVTSKYIRNAGFDNAECLQTTNIATQDSPNSKTVGGWTLSDDAVWCCGAAFAYGSGAQLNGVDVPASGADGSNGMLGLSVGWGGKQVYKQEANLPAGRYRMTYAYQNVNTGSDRASNLIGVIEQNGTTHYGTTTNFGTSAWRTEQINFDIRNRQTVTFSVGIGAVDGGSGSNAKLAIDYVKLEMLEPYSLTDAVLKQFYYLQGDVDGNDQIEVEDNTLLSDILLGKADANNRTDVNRNSVLNIGDQTSLIALQNSDAEPVRINQAADNANICAMVYAEQSSAENIESSNYMVQSATNTRHNADVADYIDMLPYLTTLTIDASAIGNVESVSIFAIDKTTIAGPMEVKTQNENVTSRNLSPSSSKTNYAANLRSNVVTVKGGIDGTFTAYLLPATLAKGIKVTARTADGKFYSQDFQITANTTNNLVMDVTEAQNLWMATLPGNTRYNMLSIPGSHDAATSSITNWLYVSSAKCQSETIAEQLKRGVRAFDIRPAYKNNKALTLDNLTIYHGVATTGVLFKDAIATLVQFVKDNPSETVNVIMQKESNSGTDQSPTWRESVRTCFAQYPNDLVQNVSADMTLDDCRGKLLIISKTPYGTENVFNDIVNGGKIEDWGDNANTTAAHIDNEWASKAVDASIQDSYNSKIADKKPMIIQYFKDASSDQNSRWYYNFISEAKDGPSKAAQSLNPYAAEQLAFISGRLGLVFGDFMGSDSNGGRDILKAIINQNYKYIYEGRSHVFNE